MRRDEGLYLAMAVTGLLAGWAAFAPRGSRRPGDVDWEQLELQAHEQPNPTGRELAKEVLVLPEDEIEVWHGGGIAPGRRGPLTGRQPLHSRLDYGNTINDVGRWLTSSETYARDLYAYGTPQRVARFRVPPGRYAVIEPHGGSHHELGGDETQLPRALMPRDRKLIGQKLWAQAKAVERKRGGAWDEFLSPVFRLLKGRLWIRNPAYTRRLHDWYTSRGYQGFVMRAFSGDDVGVKRMGPQDVWMVLGEDDIVPQVPWGSRAQAHPSWDVGPTPGTLLGYRIMRYDPAARQAVSGADSRIRLPVRVGESHSIPRPGMFLTNRRQYAVDYYLAHDVNAVLTYAFRPEDVALGELDDREPEIAVPVATLVRVELLDDEAEPWRST